MNTLERTPVEIVSAGISKIALAMVSISLDVEQYGSLTVIGICLLIAAVILWL